MVLFPSGSFTAAYARMNFGMFGDEEVRAKLHFRNEMVGVLPDRFVIRASRIEAYFSIYGCG